MSRFYTYLNAATRLIESYKQGTPFIYHLKTYFSKEKKIGSRDRKIIGGLCYNYFRVARSLEDARSVREKIIIATFLCETERNELIELFNPELNLRISLDWKEKISMLSIDFKFIFPFEHQISEALDYEMFCASLLKKPKVFARIRPGREAVVLGKLKAAGIPYLLNTDDCLEFSSGVALDKLLVLNKDVVIQDNSSQQVFEILLKQPDISERTDTLKVWDSCAASGGKSILLYDRLKGKVKLTVSDIRENILFNLKKRLQYAGVNIYRSFVKDLSVSSGLSGNDLFEIVICDVPCSGSGTWSRTPEQLYSFEEKSLHEFVSTQKSIVLNAIKHTQKSGYFVYITCSVFKEENEGLVTFITENSSAKLIHSHYIKGYEKASDTMFVAVFGL